MNPVQNILVIVDPTAVRHPAVDKSAVLAQALHSRLELFIADTQASQQARTTVGLAEGKMQPLRSTKALLEALATPLRAQGIDVATDIECVDHLHEGLLARIRRSSADWVVKDTHHHTILHRTLLSNTDWELIRSSPVPLLLAKARSWPTRARIVAAVDPGHSHDRGCMLDRYVLESAVALSKALDAELHVLNAFVPQAAVGIATARDLLAVTTAFTEQIASERRARLEEICSLAQPFGVAAADVHVELGGALDVLPKMAQTLGADIMVMGALSRRAWRRFIIGSTAESVLERLPCDAMIIKPPDFASLLPF